MQFLLNSKPLRRFFLLRRVRLSVLPLFLLNGALVQVASAQVSGAAPASNGSPALYSLFQNLCALALLALIVGAVRPQTFTFLFKEKTNRKRVCGIFGAAMLGFAMAGSAFEPKPAAPVVTAQERRARSDQAKAQSQARAAEGRAKAAEARAEKASASESVKAKANAKNAESSEAPAPEPKAAPKGEELPSNVTVMKIPGVGSRQVGEVDDVEYAVLRAETVASIGDTRADGVFYVLRVAASNSDKTTHDVTTMLMKLLDDQEREFDPSDQGGLALALSGDQSAQSFSAQVQPGVTKQFTLVYDAPADAKGLKLKIPAGGFGFGQDAVIKVPAAD